MKINYNKLFKAIDNSERLPRKIKKSFLGKRMNKSKLKKLLDSVKITKTPDTMYDRYNITPYLFCPNCGCIHTRSTGNMTSYPEHWEHFYCLRCNKLVGAIDNSPYYHVLEFSENNYDFNF